MNIMNRKLFVLILCLGMQAFMANAEFREFTDTKGRVIEAELISYNALREKVTVKLKGKGNKTVPISIFSETDQNYIVSWEKTRGFLDEQKLNLKGVKTKMKMSPPRPEPGKETGTTATSALNLRTKPRLTLTTSRLNTSFSTLRITTFAKILIKKKSMAHCIKGKR